MKQALRSLFRIFLLFLVAIGVVAAAMAGCVVAAMVFVWLQEGRLLVQDQRILVRAIGWLLGTCVFVFLAWRLANLVGPRDNSFRLTRSTSAKSDERVQTAGLMMLFALAAIWLWGSYGGPVVVKIVVVLGWLFLGVLAQHVHILLHELGHFLAAWALRFELRRLQVGVGSLIYSRSFANGFRFEWRLSPRGGFMFAINPLTRNFRRRQFLYIAGGPVMDAVVLSVGCLLIFGGGFSPMFLESSAGVFVCLWFAWIALAFLGNLIPQMVWIGGQKVWSDARWLWMLCTKSRRRIAQLLAQVHWQYAREQFGDIQPLFASERSCPAPIDAAMSRETFQSQSLRLRSRLLPSR